MRVVPPSREGVLEILVRAFLVTNMIIWHLVGRARDAKHAARNPRCSTHSSTLPRIAAPEHQKHPGHFHKHQAHSRFSHSPLPSAQGHWNFSPLAPSHHLGYHLLRKPLISKTVPPTSIPDRLIPLPCFIYFLAHITMPNDYFGTSTPWGQEICTLST